METVAELPEPLARYRPLVEAELRALLGSQSLPLYRMMRYQLGWADTPDEPEVSATADRLRSTLCLLACQSLGGDALAAIPAAAAVELVHNFYLIHHDIQGGTPQRAGRPTVWWLWGPAQGINVGDGMHALARLCLFRLQERGVPKLKVLRAIQALDAAALRLCEGRFLDLSFRERVDVGEQQYWRMVEAKAGGMVGCTMQLGALVATDDEDTVDAFRRCGERLGIALQLVEDIRGLWGGSPEELSRPSDDVMSMAKPLPVVYALEKGTVAQKKELGSIYFKRTMDADDAARLVVLLDEAGARDYVQEKAEALVREAIGAVEERGVAGAGLADLQAVAEFIVRC
ncbi:MAG: polyprenyl synthetase family protein [Chloroflexi bacterium]|nr:polyprenyl synthetase family protein [Chloroflexota bacterium]